MFGELGLRGKDSSMNEKGDVVAVGSPGAKVHNTAAPTPSGGEPPAWAEALRDELRGGVGTAARTAGGHPGAVGEAGWEVSL